MKKVDLSQMSPKGFDFEEEFYDTLFTILTQDADFQKSFLKFLFPPILFPIDKIKSIEGTIYPRNCGDVIRNDGNAELIIRTAWGDFMILLVTSGCPWESNLKKFPKTRTACITRLPQNVQFAANWPGIRWATWREILPAVARKNRGNELIQKFLEFSRRLIPVVVSPKMELENWNRLLATFGKDPIEVQDEKMYFGNLVGLKYFLETFEAELLRMEVEGGRVENVLRGTRGNEFFSCLYHQFQFVVGSSVQRFATRMSFGNGETGFFIEWTNCGEGRFDCASDFGFDFKQFNALPTSKDQENFIHDFLQQTLTRVQKIVSEHKPSTWY